MTSSDAPRLDINLEPLALLDPSKITALEHLLAGSSVKEAADAAGVHRGTVHRWKREDFAFRAVYNRRRRELQRAAVSRVHQMMHTALDQLEEDLEAGRLSPAQTLRFLESAGVLSGELPDPGPTTVQEQRGKAVEQLAKRQSSRSAREWIQIVDDMVDEGEIAPGGTFSGLQTLSDKRDEMLETGEWPDDPAFEPEEGGADLTFPELIRWLHEDASDEAVGEWLNLITELDREGSDLTGASKLAYVITLRRLRKQAEDEAVDGEGQRADGAEQSDEAA